MKKNYKTIFAAIIGILFLALDVSASHRDSVYYCTDFNDVHVNANTNQNQSNYYGDETITIYKEQSSWALTNIQSYQNGINFYGWIKIAINESVCPSKKMSFVSVSSEILVDGFSINTSSLPFSNSKFSVENGTASGQIVITGEFNFVSLGNSTNYLESLCIEYEACNTTESCLDMVDLNANASGTSELYYSNGTLNIYNYSDVPGIGMAYPNVFADDEALYFAGDWMRIEVKETSCPSKILEIGSFSSEIIVDEQRVNFNNLPYSNSKFSVTNSNGKVLIDGEFSNVYLGEFGTYRINSVCVISRTDCEITSANSLKVNNMNVYPNPADEILNLDLGSDKYNVLITDISGKLIKEINNVSGIRTVDISELSSGTYYVKASNNSEIKSAKVVVK